MGDLEDVNALLRARIDSLEYTLRDFIYRLEDAERHGRDLTPLERKIKGHSEAELRREV